MSDTIQTYSPDFGSAGGDVYVRMPDGTYKPMAVKNTQPSTPAATSVTARGVSVTVAVTAPGGPNICVAALFQSPIEGDVSAYAIPLGHVTVAAGQTAYATFSLEPDTQSVWWEEVGWYYDQTNAAGGWVAGIPNQVGKKTWPRGLTAPAAVKFIEVEV